MGTLYRWEHWGTGLQWLAEVPCHNRKSQDSNSSPYGLKAREGSGVCSVIFKVSVKNERPEYMPSLPFHMHKQLNIYCSLFWFSSSRMPIMCMLDVIYLYLISPISSLISPLFNFLIFYLMLLDFLIFIFQVSFVFLFLSFQSWFHLFHFFLEFCQFTSHLLLLFHHVSPILHLIFVLSLSGDYCLTAFFLKFIGEIFMSKFSPALWCHF